LCVTEGTKLVLARALATANAQAWQAALTDEAARARLLSNLSRDLKISVRARKANPQKLLLSGPLAALPGAVERLGAELQIPAEPASLPAGDPGAALALGLALRAQSVLGLFLGTARVSSLHRQASAYDDAVCSATRRILGTCLTDYRQAVAQLAGGKSRAAGIPRVSAAEILAELVAHMPDGSATLLDDVEVTTTALRVKGTAESFGRVDEIIAALKKDKCFGEIKQPRVEKLRDGSKV